MSVGRIHSSQVAYVISDAKAMLRIIFVLARAGIIILIMLDDDARQCCRLLYVFMCTALRDTFLLEKLGE